MSAATIREQGAGIVLVISAPSGTGKSSVVRRIGGLRFSISYTTRARRGDEENGVDYHFVNSERFHQMSERGEFLEWAEVHGHYYGTASAMVRATLDAGDDVLLDLTNPFDQPKSPWRDQGCMRRMDDTEETAQQLTLHGQVQ